MGFGDFMHGLGEAAGDVGEAVGGDWVVDQAQKAPDAARNAWKASQALGKGAAYIGNPTHWDDIAGGAVNAAQFVAKNPGQTWDVGFEVGRAVVKDQLDPVNLAINAGLIGLTIATGGAAAPALAAKIGMGLKSAKVGIEAVQAGEGVVEGVRAARAANTAFRAVRGAEEAVGAVKAGEAAVDVGRGVKEGTEAAREISRGDAFLGGIKRTQEGVEAGPTLMSRVMNPVSRPIENFMQNSVRNPLAERILAGGAGEEAGFARQAAAAVVQGNTGNMPTRLAGQSENFARLNKTMWRGRQVAAKTIGLAQKAGTIQTAYDITANPAGYAKDKAEGAWEEHGDEAMAQAAPYVQQAQQARQATDPFRSGPDQSKEREPFDPIDQPSMRPEQAIGMTQFRLDRTHATRTSRRQPNQAAQLGTVTTNVDMPTQIGPSNWYGPQGGYDAGRGFQQRDAQPAMGLAPLEQPQPARDLVGI